jgi:hypothetical protein
VVMVVCVALAIYGWNRELRRREMRGYLEQAETLLIGARELEARYRHDREQALRVFADFDATRPGTDEEALEKGEFLWKRFCGNAP